MEDYQERFLLLKGLKVFMIICVLKLLHLIVYVKINLF